MARSKIREGAVMTLEAVRTEISNRLQEAGIESFAYETWVFLEWKLGIGRADYYMDPHREISPENYASLNEAVLMREKRIPLQYIMKQCDFMGYDFYVDERVLIPRQDTECLVEEALAFIKERKNENRQKQGAENKQGSGNKQDAANRQNTGSVKIRVLDLCCGSGCIGISIKLLCPESEVLLADLSRDALAVTDHNARELKADVKILQGDLFQALECLPQEERKFDIIVSNPPYIPSEVVKGLMPEVRDHEPHMALDGSGDGLYFYRKITEQAPAYLKDGGGLYYEIGAEQGEEVSNLLKERGFSHVFVQKDLASLDRIVKGRLS